MISLVNHPAIQEAINFVSENIEKQIWPPGARLPSVDLLAKSAKVSAPTMLKAIAILKKRGSIVGRARRRSYVAGNGVAAEPIQAKSAPWQVKRRILEQDLLSGVFGSGGSLPSLKELQAHYGVCFTTMKKIVQAMVNDHELRAHGRGYELRSARSKTAGQRIVYITMRGYLSQRSSLNQENNKIVTLFENECKVADINLEIIEIDFFDSTETRRALSKLLDDHRILGAFLDVWWYEASHYRQNYLSVLDRLASFKKPVALLDENGNFDLPLRYVTTPLIQVFTFEQSRAGERMARLLLSLGHRSIAYISIFHYAPWARERYEGVLAQFTRADCGSGVELIADSVVSSLPNVLTASGFSDEDVRAVVSIGRTKSQIVDLEMALREFKKSHQPPYPGFPRWDHPVCKRLASIIRLIRRDPGQPVYEKACLGALEALATMTLSSQLNPHLERALKNKKVTAWVCANDFAAFGALSFLRERNIRVPAELSVAGFDNTPVLALEQRLTTLDFNAAGFISGMLNFVLHPKRSRGPYRHHPIEVESIVMERGTTGKPPSHRGLSSRSTPFNNVPVDLADDRS